MKQLTAIYTYFFGNHKSITVHPKYGKVIEYLFSCGFKHYYKLVNDYEIFEERSTLLLRYTNEMEMKVTSEVLSDFLEAIMNQINEGKLGDAANLVKELQYRKEWLFEPETLYRLGSVVYFDLEENIKDYDMAYNKAKIASFKKKGLMSYFLEKLMKGSDPFLNLSTKDSQQYILKLNDLIKRQTSLVSKMKHSKSKKSSEKQTTA